MTTPSKDKCIKLSKEVEGTHIEIWIESEDVFREGYATLKRMCQRVIIEDARFEAEVFWKQEGKKRIIHGEYTNPGHKIALSLLDCWPECKKRVRIVEETDLSSTGVQDHLTGRRGDTSLWFEKCEDGWKLSSAGITNLPEVIPTFLS